MKKENFSFVKWLTNRDVEKILNSMGIELLTDNYDRNGNLLKPIKKYRDKETGKYRIIVKCQLNEDLIDKNNELNDFVLPSKLKNAIKDILFKSSIVFASMPLMNSFSSYFDDSRLILEINDFYICELLSLKLEEEQVKFDRVLTKGYQSYMTKKFGRFYNCMKSAAIKKAIAEEKENHEEEKEN